MERIRPEEIPTENLLAQAILSLVSSRFHFHDYPELGRRLAFLSVIIPAKTGIFLVDASGAAGRSAVKGIFG